MLAPWAVLRFTRARSAVNRPRLASSRRVRGWRGDATNAVRSCRACPRIDHRCFGRAFPHCRAFYYSAARGLRLPVAGSYIEAGRVGWVRGCPPAPPRPRPASAASALCRRAPAPFGFHRQPKYYRVRPKILGLPKKPLTLRDSRSRPPRNPFFLGTLHCDFGTHDYLRGSCPRPPRGDSAPTPSVCFSWFYRAQPVIFS